MQCDEPARSHGAAFIQDQFCQRGSYGGGIGSHEAASEL